MQIGEVIYRVEETTDTEGDQTMVGAKHGERQYWKKKKKKRTTTWKGISDGRIYGHFTSVLTIRSTFSIYKPTPQLYWTWVSIWMGRPINDAVVYIPKLVSCFPLFPLSRCASTPITSIIECNRDVLVPWSTNDGFGHEHLPQSNPWITSPTRWTSLSSKE